MTDILVRLFIKDYKNTSDNNVREKYGILSGVVGIITNIFLFFIKYIVGTIVKSIAIVADSFNNLSDCVSSIVTLIGFKIANKPPDKEHPFGHGRVEYIAGLVVAFFVLIIGFEFLKSSVIKIFNPEETVFRYIYIIVLGISVLIKLWQGLFYRKIGKKINSLALIATSHDSLNDCIITIVTIISLFTSKYTGILVDGYFGFIVSIFLLKSGIDIIKDTLSPILGEAIDIHLSKDIKEIINKHEYVLGVHDLIVHNYGPSKNIASIHVEVPSDMSVTASHNIIDSIEKEILQKLGILITIHIDPVNVNDTRLSEVVRVINNIVNEFKSNYDDLYIDIHDIRIIDCINCSSIVFDLDRGYDIDLKIQIDLILKLKQEIEDLNSSYNCIINIEKGF